MLDFIRNIATFLHKGMCQPPRGSPLSESTVSHLMRQLEEFGAERVDLVIEIQLAGLKRRLDQLGGDAESSAARRLAARRLDDEIETFLEHWFNLIYGGLVKEAAARLAGDIESARLALDDGDPTLVDQAVLGLIECEIDKRSDLIRASIRIMRNRRLQELEDL